MGNYRVIAKEVKEHVVHRVKEEGISVSQAARDAGVSVQSVYDWLGKGTSGEPGILEINKLKRENQFLLELVGKLTKELELEKRRGKK
jgi:transposase-like protein